MNPDYTDEFERQARDWLEQQFSEKDFHDFLSQILVELLNLNQKPLGVHPTLVCLGTKDDADEYPAAVIKISNPNWDDHDFRLILLNELGQQVWNQNELKLIAVFLITEAWIVRTTPEEYEQAGKPKPSESADRKEVIAISGMAIDRRTGVNFIPIERDADGHIILGESQTHLFPCDHPNSSLPNLVAFWRGYGYARYRENLSSAN